MLPGDALGDCEAEAVTGLARVEPEEALEDALALLFGDPGAVVVDAGLDVAVPPLEAHVDPAVGPDGGESVVDQVAEDALERVGVAAHGGVGQGVERDRGPRRPCPRVFDEGKRERDEVDGDACGVRLEACEPEQIVDEAA